MKTLFFGQYNIFFNYTVNECNPLKFYIFNVNEWIFLYLFKF